MGSKTYKSIVEHIKRKYFYDGGTIDEFIITHPHEDHIYDIANLYKKLLPIALYREKDAFDITPTVNTTLHNDIAFYANKMNADYNQPLNKEFAPTESSFNGGAEFEIINPKSQWTTKSDLNTFSNIIVVKAYGYKFVLTGDNPKSILDKMMDENFDYINTKIKDATVLLAPHHGRTGEYSEKFFKCVNPKLTIVSDKSIEHDTQVETARLYRGRGMLINGEYRYVLTTRNDGCISFDFTNSYFNVDCGKEGY